MATQEEVLEVIKQNGFMSLKSLKEHFGVGKSGSSWLPQRLRALEKKDMIISLRSGNVSIYIANDFECKWEEAKQILLEWGLLSKRPRGRPKGSYEYREESILKLLSFIRENKIVNWRQIREEMCWDTRMLNKYLNKLVKDGMIFEIKCGKLRLFTTSLL